MIIIAGGAVIVCVVVIAIGMFCLHKYELYGLLFYVMCLGILRRLWFVLLNVA